MGVLTQLQPTIPRPSTLAIAMDLVATPLPAEPIRTADPVKCPQCLDTSFWLPIGSREPLCFVCRPPVSLALVAKQYFFDDWGNLWRVEKNQDGSESYVRESFEPGSPDVYE